jgi:predicted MFS family arabinose efflux permease
MPLVLLPHWGAAALSFIGVVALTAIRIPAFLVYSMEAVAPEQRTILSGANEMANGLGFAIIDLGGGYIITALGYRPLFLLSACLTAVGTLVFWWCCYEGTARPPNTAGSPGDKRPPLIRQDATMSSL